MKIRWYIGIRFKFLMIFASSIIATVTSIVIIQTLLETKMSVYYGDIASWDEKYSFVYFTAFLLLTTLFFYIFSRGMITRMENISRMVNRMKEGNLDIQIPIQSRDEIGDLARNINGMIQSLKESIHREQQAEAIKNEMISNISHDLRTPLTSLIGYIELIKTNIHNDVEQCYKYVDISQRKCHELKKQIHDLLEYCHINFRGIHLAKEVVGVKELIQQVMIDFVPQLEEAGMSFSIACEPQKINIEADISLIVRLLQNIISNSIFYGKSGKNIDIAISKEDADVLIKIANYGKPIDPEDIPYIFERFYRGEKSRSANTGGKGMGLAIAKSIAVIHEGSISASSNEKETAFLVSLPLSTRS
ncbi:sensor histidine kinase [Brevibacillus sp. SYSU BS000544]|uniref:sensor histidine kinase n=1 Tax=Brevibacillus sp. SYSU BS000544 TaxID=3416443 RepID=UPI003CE56E7C